MKFIQNTLNLSTAHIPFLQELQTYDFMDEDFEEFGIQRAVHHHHGIIVFVAPEKDPEEIKDILLDTPEWFRPILMMAIENDCHLINFDDDAPIHPGFITYAEATEYSAYDEDDTIELPIVSPEDLEYLIDEKPLCR